MVAGGQRTLLKQRWGRGLLCSLAALLCWAVSAQAGTYVVTNTNDAGAGSLRQAILDLNADGDASSTITFQSSGTINLATPFDQLTGNVTFVNGAGVTVILPSVMGGTLLAGLSMSGAGTVISGVLPNFDVTGANDINLGVSGDANVTLTSDLSGTIRAESGNDEVYGVASGNDLTLRSMSGSVTAVAGNDRAAGLFGANSIVVAGDLSGAISVTVGNDDAEGLSSPEVVIGGDLSGTITAEAGGGGAFGVFVNTFDLQGDLSGTITSTSVTDTAAGIDAVTATIGGDFSGTITAHTDGDGAAGISAGLIGVGGDFSGTITSSAGTTDAYGLTASLVVVDRNLSGSISATTGTDGAFGIYTDVLAIGEDFSGSITASAGNDTGVGISSFDVDLRDMSGSIVATAVGNEAFGLYAGGDMFLRGALSGTISATAGGHSALGILNDVGGINGGDAGTPAVISGSVRAEANGLAVGIAAWGGMNLGISGTVSGVDTSGGGSGYAIRSGKDDMAGGWDGDDDVDDSIALVSGAHLIGHVDLGGGSDIITGTGTVTGDLRSSDSLEKSGQGVWTINGQTSVSDLLHVSGGSLRLSSNTAGSFTNTVTGNLTVGAGGSLEVAIHQTAVSSLDVTGLSTVDGSVVFIPATPLAPGATFTAMNAGNLGATAGYAAPLFAVDTSSGTSVVLTKLGYSEVVPLSPNAQTLADMLEPCMVTATGDLCFLLLALENASTVEEFEANLEALAPMVQTSLSSQSFGLGGMFSAALGLHLAQAREAFTALADAGLTKSGVSYLGMDPDDPSTWPLLADAGDLSTLGLASSGTSSGMSLLDDRKTSVFLRALASEGGTADSGDYFGHTSRTFGLTGGVDRLLGQGLVGGLNLGFANTSAKYNDEGSTAEIRSWNLGVFASLFEDDWYVDAALSLGINRYVVVRDLAFVGRTAESSYGGRLFSASVESGWSLPAGFVESVVLTPLASLTFARLDQEGYEENGAGAANLTVAAHSRHSLVSGLGLRVSLPLETAMGSVVPEVSATWTHEYLTRDLGVETTMAGNPGEVYTMLGAEPERDTMRLEAGVGMQSDNGSSLTLRWQGDYRENAWSNGGMVEYRISF